MNPYHGNIMRPITIEMWWIILEHIYICDYICTYIYIYDEFDHDRSSVGFFSSLVVNSRGIIPIAGPWNPIMSRIFSWKTRVVLLWKNMGFTLQWTNIAMVCPGIVWWFVSSMAMFQSKLLVYQRVLQISARWRSSGNLTVCCGNRQFVIGKSSMNGPYSSIFHTGWGPPVISWFINHYNTH